MFRGPQRSLLLLLRESHLSALSGHTGDGCQGVRHVKGWRCEKTPGRGRTKEETSLPTETVSCSAQLYSFFRLDCVNHRLKETSFQYHLPKAILSTCCQSPQTSTSEKARQVCNPRKRTLVENFEQTSKVGSQYSDCLTNTFFFKLWRRPWDFCQPLLSFISKTQCNLLQSHLYYRQHSVRPFSFSTHAPKVLKNIERSPQSSSFSPQQIRTIHQAATHVVDGWRDCLSPENENRCRQNLAPNLKLYEVEKVRQGASQRQGKNQGRCASILVSLCSVEGKPVFLFTLRSSTLKGRHKGDVSFAGGKSDPSDRDVVATALREAKEELGITVAAERVWGVLKPLRDVSGMMIAPVLANLGPLEELTFKPNPGEVEEIFTMSLSHLCNPHNRGYTHFRTGDKYGYTLPVFRNGKHRVWGLTAVALDHTLKLIVTS